MDQDQFDPNRTEAYSQAELLRLYRLQVQLGRSNLTENDLDAGRQHLATAEQIRFRFTTDYGKMPSDLVIRL